MTPDSSTADRAVRPSEDAGGTHRAALLTLVVLTLASGTATRWVAATNPGSLVPWVILFALAVAWTFRRPRTVDLFEPFTFLSWVHYAPAFVVGSALLAVGIVDYPYATIVADPVAACALALAYIGIAYLSLQLGCRWRGARALGAQLARMLPAQPVERTIPFAAILALIAIGMAANYGAFRAGIIGFALPRPPGPLDAAVSYGGLFAALGHFLFWFRWFAPDQARLPKVTLLVPLLFVVATMVILGNRGALLLFYLYAVLAYRFARGRLTLPQGIAVVTLAFVALGIGMTYGTTFRHLRGGETGTAAAAAKDTAGTAGGPSLERQFEVAAEAATVLFHDPGSTPLLRGILASAGDRLNLVSDASVTIARYPALRSLEAEHGIANLWTMTWTAFVPRVLWPDKPKVGDARAYAALYFDFGGNSFATTPPVDLIRNVGPFGMPLGMAVFGVLLGALSAALLAPTSAGRSERAALFSVILLNINLEGPFGLLLPTMFRVTIVAVVGLALVRLFTRRA